MSDELDKYSGEKEEFLRQFNALRPDLFMPQEWDGEKRNLALKELRSSTTKTAMFANIPMKCVKNCHPVGTQIKTSDGYVAIEELDPNEHLLISYDMKCQAIRGGWKNSNPKGYNFKKGSRTYDGYLYQITDGIRSYSCTHDHDVIVRWSEEARNSDLFCVYLMRKGLFWRVGKTVLFHTSTNQAFGPLNRARGEGADAFWILGIYQSNTEALLAEEFFSCKYGIAKSCFVVANRGSGQKYDGLYKWITSEQLAIHHYSLIKVDSHYETMLSELGLDINHPFMDLKKESMEYGGLKAKQPTRIRHMKLAACNIQSGLMECPTEDVYKRDRNRFSEKRKSSHNIYKPIWRTIFTNRTKVTQLSVFSLEVTPYHTYIANGLVTHNCIYKNSCPLLAKGIAPFGSKCALEASFVQQFFADYVEELNIDLNLMVEVSMARDLVDQEIQYLRKTAVMAEDHFIQENVVGVDHEGKVITKKELHQAVDYEDRIHRRKERLRSALLATREARAKVGQVQLDTAQAISNIVESARKAELAKKKELDKALGTELRDEYIEAEIVTDDDAPDR